MRKVTVFKRSFLEGESCSLEPHSPTLRWVFGENLLNFFLPEGRPPVTLPAAPIAAQSPLPLPKSTAPDTTQLALSALP